MAVLTSPKVVIKEIKQADYDALVQTGAVDPTVQYNIVDAPAAATVNDLQNYATKTDLDKKQNAGNYLTTDTAQTITALKSVNVSQINNGANVSIIEGTMLPLWSSSESHADIPLKDQNGKRVGILRYSREANGTRGMQLIPVDANDNPGTPIEVNIDTNGVTHHTAITPDDSSNSQDVATSQWVRTRMESKDALNMYSNASMPTNRYETLTLAANQTYYTAPADGYVSIRKAASAANQYLQLNAAGTTMGLNTWSNGTGTVSVLCIPVAKGEQFRVDYNYGGNTEWFRFVYANGSTK